MLLEAQGSNWPASPPYTATGPPRSRKLGKTQEGHKPLFSQYDPDKSVAF